MAAIVTFIVGRKFRGEIKWARAGQALSFIVASLRWRLGLVANREFARHRLRRVVYIGVPRAVVERRTQRGQLIRGPQAPVPVFVPFADFFQFQAGAGRAAAARAAARGDAA